MKNKTRGWSCQALSISECLILMFTTLQYSLQLYYAKKMSFFHFDYCKQIAGVEWKALSRQGRATLSFATPLEHNASIGGVVQTRPAHTTECSFCFHTIRLDSKQNFTESLNLGRSFKKRKTH